MYFITGADGKEYGPVPLELLQKWIAEGRVNAQTKMRVESSDAWQTAAEFPEVNHLLKAGVPPVGVAGQTPPAAPAAAPATGLATVSLLLGILGITCLGITAIPAIICGHIALSRTRRSPATYGGFGMALAGLIMGYIGLFMLLILPAMLLPALAKAKSRAQAINCTNNMKQLGLAFKIWAIDNEDQFPFNVSTNKGGTLEFASQGPDGVDPKAYLHLMVMSNELSTPKILVCPGDSKTAASDFSELKPENVSYQIMSGTNLTEANPSAVLAMCPVHGHVLTVDGAVQSFGKTGKKKRR